MYPKLHLQTFYSHFHVTSGQMMSLPVTSGHVRLRDVISCHVPAPPASYSPVGAQTYPKVDLQAFYSHFQGTYGKLHHLRVNSGHVRSCDVIPCHLL